MARSETLHRALAVIPNRKTRLEQGAAVQHQISPKAAPTMCPTCHSQSTPPNSTRKRAERGKYRHTNLQVQARAALGCRGGGSASYSS